LEGLPNPVLLSLWMTLLERIKMETKHLSSKRKFLVHGLLLGATITLRASPLNGAPPAARTTFTTTAAMLESEPIVRRTCSTSIRAPRPTPRLLWRTQVALMARRLISGRRTMLE